MKSPFFDQLHRQKKAIDATFRKASSFDEGLVWERGDDFRYSRIACQRMGNIFENEDWQAMIEFLVEAMVLMESAFEKPLVQIDEVLEPK